ncbi:MAG TPA: MFS transporter, partial [Acidimicrobiales bacterium]|nr:MFS transporter [Acidimicrobiales bacterium]
ALAGATGIAFLSATMTSLQLNSIPAMRGRVMALYSILFLGSTPLGGPLSGWLAQQFDTRVAIWMGAIAAVASGIVAVAALRRRESVLQGRLPAMASAS